MKVEELFIGAWVLYKGTPNKILGIHKDDSGDYRGQIDDEFKQWYLLSEFKSIPITAETLEKNGFEKTGDEQWMLNDAFPVIKGLDCVNNFWWGFYSNLVCPLNYVHELQHALKLCGVDKEIML